MKNLQVRISDELNERVKYLADLADMKMSTFVREALNCHAKVVAREQQARLTTRLERLRAYDQDSAAQNCARDQFIAAEVSVADPLEGTVVESTEPVAPQERQRVTAASILGDETISVIDAK
jgi:predicted DNA-binding protein